MWGEDCGKYCRRHGRNARRNGSGKQTHVKKDFIAKGYRVKVWQFAEVVLIGALSASAVLAQSSPPQARGACTIRPIHFDGWHAEEVANTWVQLIIVPELGGRLMQVTFNGHPYLFVNPKYAGKYIPPDRAAGRWINYGGDKIWPLPEGNDDEQHWTGASTPLDDGQYRFSVVSQGKRCVVRLDGPPDPPTGLQYSREIGIGVDSPEISFHSIAKNSTGHSIDWSVQSVTQYDLADPNGINGQNHEFWAFTPINPHSAYLNSYHVRDGLANDPSYSVKNDLFRLNWRYLEGEVWIDSTAGWIALVNGINNYAMVEKNPYVEGAAYPGKASVIFYKNGPTMRLDDQGTPKFSSMDREETPYYMEAEMNSPMARLAPGETYTMDTHWFPCRMGLDFRSVTEAGAIGKPLRAARQGDHLKLTEQFGVFFSGTLEARLYDRGGAERKRVTLQTVSPRNMVNLRSVIPAASNIVRVSVHLVDRNNLDRGTLGEVFVASPDNGNE